MKKRDLAVESQQVAVDSNRAVQSRFGDDEENNGDDVNCKRIRVTTQVNGFIVYTRLKKHQRNKNDVNLIVVENERIINNNKSGVATERNGVKLSVEIERINGKSGAAAVAVEPIGVESGRISDNGASPMAEQNGGELSVENERNKSSGEPKFKAIKSVLEDSLVLKNLVKRSLVSDNVVKGKRSQDSASKKKRSKDNGLVAKAAGDDNPCSKIVIDDNRLVDVLIVEDSHWTKSGIEGSIPVERIDGDRNVQCKEEPTSESMGLSARDEDDGAMGLDTDDEMEKIDFLGNTPGWFTRPFYYAREEPMSAPGAIEGEAISDLGMDDGSTLTSLHNNLESNISKKIPLTKKPATVKELFETGLLEGVTVIYMGNKVPGLRGTIKDSGILCSCSYCMGCRVIPPSQFEVHASKTYKRASQYICFENGKSLLDVMRACRNSPLSNLEATLQRALSTSPAERFFFCRRCKGSFPITCVGRVGPLCGSCADSKKPGGSSSGVVGIYAGSPEAMAISKSSSSTTTCIQIESRRQRKMSRKSLESHLSSKSPNSASDSASSQRKRLQKRPRKSLNHDFGFKSSKSDSMHFSSQTKLRLKITKKRPKEVSLSSGLGISLQNNSEWKLTTKDQRLHKLVFEKGGLRDGTDAYCARGKKLLEGYKEGFGILCYCCNSEVSPSQFEAHAGWASRRKPYAYIYTSNGVSLHDLAISLSKARKFSAKGNDDLCIICADGGDLLLCDGCPRVFHKDCASLSNAPHGEWYCKYCQDMFEREKFAEYNANVFGTGRDLGMDPIKETNSRCIRIVKNVEVELTGCALCRAHDFSKSGFNPRTILICDQCEREYHVGCLKTHKMADLKELPKGKWFCCRNCSNIHSTLELLVSRGAEKLPDDILRGMTKKRKEKDLNTGSGVDFSWRLLSGKIASPENRFLLAQAVAIFHECFDPIIDSLSGRDLIPSMVYGRNSRGHEYGGMYCAILTVNSCVVSAGIVRVFGQDFAELPLVATSKMNHGMGYFQMLFSCIENLLASLNVKSIVLPATEQAESIWTTKFGFKTLHPELLIKYRRNCCQMVTFEGTSMLQKTVPAVHDKSTDSTYSNGMAVQVSQILV